MGVCFERNLAACAEESVGLVQDFSHFTQVARSISG